MNLTNTTQTLTDIETFVDNFPVYMAAMKDYGNSSSISVKIFYINGNSITIQNNEDDFYYVMALLGMDNEVKVSKVFYGYLQRMYGKEWDKKKRLYRGATKFKRIIHSTAPPPDKLAVKNAEMHSEKR